MYAVFTRETSKVNALRLFNRNNSTLAVTFIIWSTVIDKKENNLFAFINLTLDLSPQGKTYKNNISRTGTYFLMA